MLFPLVSGEVELGYASALEELQSEYAWTMESLYTAAAQQMETKLQQLQLQLQPAGSAADTTHDHAPAELDASIPH